ncbi:hypothetical protein PIB30_105020, partial [Stylosanthes scabra]|nr:hypothetical protein [Stylosanthes scabra]
MLVQPSKLHKQLPNSAELRVQPPCGACATKCAAQAPFRRHLMLRAQHASQNPISMLFKHPKLIPILSFHNFTISITQIHSHSFIFIPLAPTNHNHPSSLSSFIFIITTKWQAKGKLRQRHHPQGSMVLVDKH